MKLKPEQVTYLKNLFKDKDSFLTCDDLGVLRMKIKHKITVVGSISFEKDILIYNQNIKEKYLLRIYNAWTINKIIYDKLPENSIIKIITESNIYQYTKSKIESLKNNINPLEDKYLVISFTDLPPRVILYKTQADIKLK